MKLGIVGLPNVGKSTLFNAITGGGAQSANYPFCTIEPNVGVVAVPDERLDVLAQMYNPKKVTPAVIELVDIAGLVKGASRGEGLGNKFLSHIREVDAIIHVVRCFSDDNIINVGVSPVDDIETVETELILADIEIAERRVERIAKAMKGDKSLVAEYDFLVRLIGEMNGGLPAAAVVKTDEERAFLKEMPLLSAKPVIYAANLAEDDLLSGPENNAGYQSIKALAEPRGFAVMPICVKIEEDIAELSPAEKREFLSELGQEGSGLDRLIKASYGLLGLISFLTAGEPEVRAWTITKGTRAPQAAGKIHSDFERGFIRAEIVPYEQLVECGSLAAAREKGLVRSEGKDYVMLDGDVTLFRFNV